VATAALIFLLVTLVLVLLSYIHGDMIEGFTLEKWSRVAASIFGRIVLRFAVPDQQRLAPLIHKRFRFHFSIKKNGFRRYHTFSVYWPFINCGSKLEPKCPPSKSKSQQPTAKS
jgi:hypothetical protein